MSLEPHTDEWEEGREVKARDTNSAAKRKAGSLTPGLVILA